MPRKIRINDEVIVITGKYKNKHGRVLKFLSNEYIIVENINLVKKHVKPSSKTNSIGGIITKESKINISNVSFFSIDKKVKEKIKYILKDNKKIRIIKSDKKEI